MQETGRNTEEDGCIGVMGPDEDDTTNYPPMMLMRFCGGGMEDR